MSQLTSNVLTNRAVSGFPLSIGTGLALETIFDTVQPVYDAERQVPNRVDINKYKVFYINIFTLYRNMVGSIPTQDVNSVSYQHYAEALYSEIEFIKNLLTNGTDHITPIFYTCRHEDVYKGLHRIVVPYKDNTDKQKRFTGNFVMAVKELKSYMTFDEHKDALKPINSDKSLMLSHVPRDLLIYSQVHKLDLLESHTGILKSRNLWYSKYHPIAGRDMSILPFQRKLWMVLGDKILIKPADLKFSKMIHDIAQTNRWTSMTTPDKVMFDLNKDLKDRYLFDTFRQL